MFDASVNRLIPLYAFGVFLSFTFSQSGMIIHWLRIKGAGWKSSIVINSIGAVTTGVVAVIVGGTKFVEGAWIAMVAIVVLGFLLWTIYKHYMGVERELEVPDGVMMETEAAPPAGRPRARRRAQPRRRQHGRLRPQRSRRMSPPCTSPTTSKAGSASAIEWETAILDVPLVLINSPFRSFVSPGRLVHRRARQGRSRPVRDRRAAGVPYALAVAALPAQPVRPAAQEGPLGPPEYRRSSKCPIASAPSADAVLTRRTGRLSFLSVGVRATISQRWSISGL